MLVYMYDLIVDFFNFTFCFGLLLDVYEDCLLLFRFCGFSSLLFPGCFNGIWIYDCVVCCY